MKDTLLHNVLFTSVLQASSSRSVTSPTSVVAAGLLAYAYKPLFVADYPKATDLLIEDTNSEEVPTESSPWNRYRRLYSCLLQGPGLRVLYTVILILPLKLRSLPS